MDLYRARALQVAERLQDTLSKLDKIKEDSKVENINDKKNINEKELLNRLLQVVDDVEDEGRRLEKLIDPINTEIEKLSKEEMDLYNQIVDNHPTLDEDQIVKIVQDRLLKEGLS